MLAAYRVPAVLSLSAVLFICGCSATARLSLKSSPYEQYDAMLRSSGLRQTTIGEQWAAAGESSLRSAAPITSPFSESGYFAAGQPTAVAYRLDLQRGRRLAIEVTFEVSEPGRLFVDLFRSESNGEWRRVTSLQPDSQLLEYDVDRTAAYVVRLQPELLRSGRFTLVERTLSAVRTFPVTGMTSRAVQSGFGAERNSGTRSHEGIDIFAPRGTPVVAVSDGVASPDTNGLGGNVVWLRTGLFGGTRYYYAHLDRWAIEGSTRVREGDVLGYVGNTGNARTTAPHLHFGVYDGGAIDPAPFLQPNENPPDISAEPSLLGTLVRTAIASTPILAGPATSTPQLRVLDQNTIAQRLGITRRWHRVMLPDGAVGYVAANALMTTDRPIRRLRAIEPLSLREKPLPRAPIMRTIAPGTDAEVLGRFQQFDYVRGGNGPPGWVESSRQSASRSD